MALQYAVYNDDHTEAGKFYLVEVNKDNVSNVRLTTSITDPIAENTADIAEIRTELSGISENTETILDNQARINNLEKTEIARIIEFIDRVSITYPFANATLIEIEHNRNEICSVIVNKLVSQTATETEYQNVMVHWKEVKTTNPDGSVTKKVIINLSEPITGYCVIL